MFGSSRTGASAYAKVGMETGVAAASPHRLIVMLFEGAMLSVMTAKKHMSTGDIPQKGKAISRAIDIIELGLRASLDKTQGGEIALNLDDLYAYMSTQLVRANLHNQPELLDEVHKLLSALKGAWEQIGTPAAMQQGQSAA